MAAIAIAIQKAQNKTETQSSGHFLFRRPRTWWTLLALFLMADGEGIFATQGLHPGQFTGYGAGGVDQSTLSLQITSGAMWVICAGLVYGHLGPALKLMVKQKAAVAFVILAFLSRFWSQSPGFSTSKSIMLFLYLLFTWYFVTYYKPADQRRLLLTLGVIMGVGSLLWGVFLPKYGIHATGEWKGIFGQKNMLGSGMFFLFAGLPFIPIPDTRTLRNMLLEALIPIGLILLSQSRTSLLMAFLVVVVRILGPLLIRTRREALPFLVYFVGLAVAMIPFMFIVVLPLLGRDLSLSGRTHIWSMLFPMALKRLWLGYGFQAVFVDPAGIGAPIKFGTGALASVDNGYLDILLQCGVVGVGLVFALLFTSIRDLFVLLRRPFVPLTVFWYAGLVLAIFLGSVSENMLWKPIRLVPFVLAFGSAGLANLRYRIASTSLPPVGVKVGR